LARTLSPRTTAAFRASCAWRPSASSRPAKSAHWWPPPRWSWESISVTWTWSARSAPRAPSPWPCSASAAPDTGAGATPKGRIFVTTRDELLECAALVRAVRHGDLDRLLIPAASLDVLAQQIVAACAAEDFLEDDLFALVRRAYPYRALPRAEFDELLAMLSEGISAGRGRYGSYLFRDRVNHRLRARRGARLAAITNGGAIPENALYTVVAMPDDTVVGTVDEDFAVESLAGDIMLLGNTSWRIRRVQMGRVIVEDAQGAPPNIPFWLGEAPARTAELSQQVSELREKIGACDDTPAGREATVAWLQRECGLDRAGAEQAVAYVLAGRFVLGAVPSQNLIVAERFFDESGGMQLIIHAPFGARINKAWGLALRKRFCRSFNFELQAAATDNGLNISLSDQHSFPLGDVFHFLHPNSVQEVLEQAVLASPLFPVRWRWAAGRALALLRFQGGKRVAPQIQRMRAEDLLAAVFPQALACLENIVGDIEIPNHPLARETMKDVLTEALDIEGLKSLLTEMAAGRIRCLAVDTTVPSVFSHEILNANPYAFLDDAPLEERRARAVELRRVLPGALTSEVGRLDPAAIAEVRADAWPDARDADELHDALLTLVALPEPDAAAISQSAGLDGSLLQSVARSIDGWRAYFEVLAAGRRATRAFWNGRTYWVCAERAANFSGIFAGVEMESPLPEVGEAAASREDALLQLAAGWMGHCGPATAGELGRVLGLPAEELEKTLLRLEASGAVLRGQFTGGMREETEWCERRLLARIHRLTLGELRRQIQPVSPAQYMSWLLHWQHVAPGTQLAGERGMLEIVRQLQGLECPASSWERQILKRRVANYAPEMLDQLCMSGAVGWGRLSPHPSTLAAALELTAETRTAAGRRVVPTSAAPIAFFVREDADWMLCRQPQDPAQHKGLSPAAREILGFLQQRGASFFPDIVRGTGKLKAEVETALWELVTAGVLTADGFDNLRALIDPKRRAGHGAGRTARPRHSAGRWSLLYVDPPAADRTRALEAVCSMLLRRYGVVFREVLSRESILPSWREVLLTLRRLEDRGEVRGGRFVSDFVGEQFALPVAVESLRAMRQRKPSGEMVTVSAADPLNMTGVLIPGDRVPANSGRFVTYVDGGLADEERPAVAELSAAL
jgi:ATP-dependent Lhr-like helicase